MGVRFGIFKNLAASTGLSRGVDEFHHLISI